MSGDGSSAAQPPTVRAASWSLRGLFVLALICALQVAQPLLAPLVIAVVLTFVLAPGVRALRRHGIPESIGAGLMVLLLLGSVLPLAAILFEPAAEWWERAPATMTDMVRRMDRLRASIPGLEPPPRVRAASVPQADPVKQQIATEGALLARMLVGRGLTTLFSVAATLILLYFLLASEHWLVSRSVQAVPRRRMRALVLGGVRAAQREIARYLSSLALINLGVALLVGLSMRWLELPNPLLWGALAGLLNFIPYFGSILMTGLLVVAGSLSFVDLADIVAPALAYMVVHTIEANFVTPTIVGKRLSLSRISVLLSVLFWGWLWGISGALVAVPVLIGLRTVCARNRRLRLVCVFLHGERDPSPSLRSLLRARRRTA